MSTTAETAMSGLIETAAGRGGRGCDRGRGRSGRGQGRQQAARAARASIFKGASEEVNGNVFECYNEQSDR